MENPQVAAALSKAMAMKQGVNPDQVPTNQQPPQQVGQPPQAPPMQAQPPQAQSMPTFNDPAFNQLAQELLQLGQQ